MDTAKWKICRLIKELDLFEGSGTSMITIFIKPNAQVSLTRQKLVEELGAASNIKSRVNRQSVITALTSTQHLLRNYNNAPANGIAVFCGECTINDKVKKINKVFEPPEPLNRSFYMCDSRFHTEDLSYLIEDKESYGYIILDGSGVLFATVKGSNKTVISSFAVDLPKKHNKGGQSSVRFGRLRDEAIHNYITKVSENANRAFLNENAVTVNSIILAGMGSKKELFLKSQVLDPRIVTNIKHVIDVSYGGLNGLNQAISMSSTFLGNLQLTREATAVKAFMDEIINDTGKYCYGAADVVAAMNSGAAARIIVWSELPDAASGEYETLVEWLVNCYSNYGVETLELISNSTSEGQQFCKGFGGIGAILRWRTEVFVDEIIESTGSFDDFI